MEAESVTTVLEGSVVMSGGGGGGDGLDTGCGVGESCGG